MNQPSPAPGLFDKFTPYRDALAQLDALEHRPFRTVVEKVLSPTEVQIAGKRVIMVGSNNYLGLTLDPRLVEAARVATESFGVGTTGSRMANGSFDGHEALERDMAAFMDRQHCMVVTTGAQANYAAIAGLAGPNDVVLVDADNHASIWDAVRLSGAQVVRFRHNNAADLDKKLARLDDRSSNKLVLVEGCYSMAGDICPLDEFVEVTHRHNAYILVDEAHSFGVFGEHGRGVAEHFGVEKQVDFVTGTFSKSLAGTGGFVVSDHDALQYLHYSARAYMFTASGTPASVASVREALRIIGDEPELRQRLWDNAAFMRDGFTKLGFRVAPGDSPICALVIGEQVPTVLFWEALLRGGVYTNLFLPPAVPKDGCLVRTSYSAAHSRPILEEALDIFARVGREYGIIPA